MKTILFFILASVPLCSLSAQNDFASAAGVPPHYLSPEALEGTSTEPAFSAFSRTVDDVALISLGRGLRMPVTLQVLTPTTAVLVNREIPAGQTRISVDLSGFPDGTYTIRLKMGEKSWIKQIVKE